MTPNDESASTEEHLRRDVVQALTVMSERGLNRGTSGNVSVRFGAGMLITPTGIAPDAMTPDDIVLIDAAGNPADGALRPSSEWQMHWGLLAKRPDLNAVVHCHSRYATILACTGRSIPAIHYMVAVSGRTEIPVAPYHTFGSRELADAVVDALQGGYACLMQNHGQIAASASLARALAIAEQVEEQAAVYWGALAIGGPRLLSSTQMEAVICAYATYGQSKQARLGSET